MILEHTVLNRNPVNLQRESILNISVSIAALFLYDFQEVFFIHAAGIFSVVANVCQSVCQTLWSRHKYLNNYLMDFGLEIHGSQMIYPNNHGNQRLAASAVFSCMREISQQLLESLT